MTSPMLPPGLRVPRAARERASTLAYATVIVVLHLLGWGLCLAQAGRHPALPGLGLAAYLFGLRHAFDADHIAAVDDTVRLLLQKGRSGLGAGFFFSLGHSSVVFALSLLAAFAAARIQPDLPGLQGLGGLIGSVVSGVFLWIVGLFNLGVLLDLLGLWRRHRGGHAHHEHPELEALLARRGLLKRLFGRRLGSMVEHGWQMYPIGLLFGLGFDTASEIALLALSAGAAAGQAPVAAILALPLLFTAGMCLVDTADAAMMSRAYRWALLDPLRRMAYNLFTTAVSVAVALGIGSFELLRVLLERSGRPGAAAWLPGGFGPLGYGIVALFALAWCVSVLLWHQAGRNAAGSMPR